MKYNEYKNLKVGDTLTYKGKLATIISVTEDELEDGYPFLVELNNGKKVWIVANSYVLDLNSGVEL